MAKCNLPPGDKPVVEPPKTVAADLLSDTESEGDSESEPEAAHAFEEDNGMVPEYLDSDTSFDVGAEAVAETDNSLNSSRTTGTDEDAMDVEPDPLPSPILPVPRKNGTKMSEHFASQRRAAQRRSQKNEVEEEEDTRKTKQPPKGSASQRRKTRRREVEEQPDDDESQSSDNEVGESEVSLTKEVPPPKEATPVARHTRSASQAKVPKASQSRRTRGV